MLKPMSDLETLATNYHTRLCPLYLWDGQGAAIIGTGIPFLLGERGYIVTAAHVLMKLQRGGGLFTVGNSGFIPLLAEKAAITADPRIDIDMGLIGLLDEEEAAMNVRYHFTTPADCSVLIEHDARIVHLFMGYPYTRNKLPAPSVPEVRVTPTYLITNRLLDVSSLKLEKKAPEVHFAMSMPKKKVRRFDGSAAGVPEMGGMSGGGVWRVELDRTGQVLSATLVGIGIEHHGNKSTIIATKIASLGKLWGHYLASCKAE